MDNTTIDDLQARTGLSRATVKRYKDVAISFGVKIKQRKTKHGPVYYTVIEWGPFNENEVRAFVRGVKSPIVKS